MTLRSDVYVNILIVNNRAESFDFVFSLSWQDRLAIFVCNLKPVK